MKLTKHDDCKKTKMSPERKALFEDVVRRLRMKLTSEDDLELIYGCSDELIECLVDGWD